ncbi:MAG: DUF4846 domain-containing protein [Cytophagales bacterium]
MPKNSIIALLCLIHLGVFSQNSYTNMVGNSVSTRFNTPKGYQRSAVNKNSFGEYLRNLPLKPIGEKVHYYNGETKENEVYEAVVDMEISPVDLQQCADAIMRLRGEYYYSIKAFDQIRFTLTNGFTMNYTEWMQGKRIKVSNNKTTWYQAQGASNTYADFREYMDFVFLYAGTFSLSKSLKSKLLQNLAIGDVFIKGGFPGHAVIVIYMAENPQGEKVFMLAQSYMPAQETQILRNMNQKISPWYNLAGLSELITPEWTFELNQLKTW